MSRRALLRTLALTAAALVAAQWFVVRSHRGKGGKAGEAQWIWAEQRGEIDSPMAFFAVKDFELEFAPVEAAISLIADEEYHLAINSPGFGVGTYDGVFELDRYRVEDVLRVGDNQIRVELRSSRGLGGLLALLEIEGANGETLEVVTDETWRIARSADPDAMARADERPIVWGPPPAGRWGDRPAPRPALSLREMQGERRIRPLPARRWRLPGEPWRPAETFNGPPIGRWVTFDFQETRTGFLNVKYVDSGPSFGFVFYGNRRPQQGLGEPDEAIIRVRGRTQWAASRPATFRFVTVVGSPKVIGVEVLPVDPELVADRLERPSFGGLFDLERSETLVSPVENEVRRELEGLPGLAGR